MKTLIDVEQSSKDQESAAQSMGTKTMAPARHSSEPDIVASLQRAVPYIAPEPQSPAQTPLPNVQHSHIRVPQSNVPQSSTSSWESTSTIAPPQLFSAVNLGNLYPLWKERVLDNVDDLLRRWTTVSEPIYEMDAGPVNPASVSSTSVTAAVDEVLADRLSVIDKDIDEHSGRTLRLHKDNEAFSERREKIAEWFRKRERGLCDIDDSAMLRLQKEVELLLLKKLENEKDISACKDKISVLNTEKAELMSSASSTQRSPQQQQRGTFIVPESSTPHTPGVESTYSPKLDTNSTIPWLDDGLTLAADSDDEGLELAESSTTTSARPKDSNNVEKEAAAPQSKSDQAVSIKRVSCTRKAYRPPEPFLGGQNVFSHVLRTMGYPPLWFTASQDGYKFRLGSEQQGFYTVEMASEDLASHDSSTIKWTVIGKPWAHPKALTTLAWPFIEDSIGYMWIEKELGWVRRHPI